MFPWKRVHTDLYTDAPLAFGVCAVLSLLSFGGSLSELQGGTSSDAEHAP